MTGDETPTVKVWAATTVLQLRRGGYQHGERIRGLLDNSPTYQIAVGQLADSDFFFKSRKDYTLYLYAKPNHNPNPIEYWQWTNSVIYTQHEN